MKKLSFLFAALVFGAMVITSCGGGASTEGSDSAAVDSTPVTVDSAAVTVDSAAADTAAAQ